MMSMTAAEKLFSAHMNIIYFDSISIAAAKARFIQFQDAGVIKSDCSFDDMVWYTTNEYSNVGLHFSFNQFSYAGYYEAIWGLSFSEFVVCVKCYLLSIFGRRVLQTMENVLLDLRHIINANPNDIYGTTDVIRIRRPALCEDFLSILSGSVEAGDEAERLVLAVAQYNNIHENLPRNNQRTLAEVDTYVRFDEIIKDFWRTSLSKDKRLFFYPLYLWWLITAVLPLRPHEFLLTPRDCLVQNENGYFLKLRRNRIKGRRGREIAHKISEDYSTDIYRIPEYLANELQQYLDFTAEYDSTEIETLFIVDTHYKKWGQRKHNNSRYLTYVNMNTILRYYYKEVVCERLGLTIIYDREDRHLADDEIGYVHLGDTRHISLINLMKEGGTPVIAMMLAGHENTDMANHYFTNLDKWVECKTYRMYRRLTSGDTKYRLTASLTAHPLLTASGGSPLSDGGRCFSAKYQVQNFEDCLGAIGENGEIAYCPNCSFYRCKGESFFGYEDIYKRNLNSDCEALKHATKLAREGKGSIEDIGEAMLKLRASSYSYEEYLIEKYRSGK